MKVNQLCYNKLNFSNGGSFMKYLSSVLMAILVCATFCFSYVAYAGDNYCPAYHSDQIPTGWHTLTFFMGDCTGKDKPTTDTHFVKIILAPQAGVTCVYSKHLCLIKYITGTKPNPVGDWKARWILQPPDWICQNNVGGGNRSSCSFQKP